MTDEQKQKMAEEYAGVTFVGLNPYGERMYRAENFSDLTRYAERIPAFLAGLNARDEEVRLRDAITYALVLEQCAETSCPLPMRAMCSNETHKVLREALEHTSKKEVKT